MSGRPEPSLAERIEALPRSAKWSVALGLLLAGWGIAAVVLPNGAPPGRVLSGAIFGAATALSAIGLILLYRSNRIINFAFGAMGAVTGVVAIRLYLSWGWNYGVAIVVGVLGGAVVGAVLQRLVIRRFEKSSRLILTVATIGLAQLLGGLELLLPGWVFGDDSAVTLGGYETSLNQYSFTVGVDVVDGNHLLILVVVPIVVILLGWFLRRSLAGTAVRAAAENPDRVRLLGIPMRHLQMLVWAVAGSLATLTFVLQAPFSGTPPTASMGPAVLLTALAAALIGRMESLPVACTAAIVLGAVDQVVRWNTTNPALVHVVLLFIILAALLLQRRSSSRALDAEAAWQDPASTAAIPAALRRLPEVRALRIGGAVLVVAAVLLVPATMSEASLFTLSVATIWGIVTVSLVILTGWNGQISLGQFAFVGVGAIVAGNLMSRWNVDLFLSMAAASAAGALVAFLLGVPALRIRGPFLAVVTLSFAVVLDAYVLNPNIFPELIPQSVERPVLLQRWPLDDQLALFYVTLAGLAFSVLVARGVRMARSGRTLIAGRDNRKASEAMAVSSRRMSLNGFVLSGAIAGMAGSLHMMLLNGARVGSYQVVASVEVFSSSVIGGMSSIAGATTSSIGLRALQDQVDAGLRLVLYGVALLVVLLVVPGGLIGVAFNARDRILGVLARRRGIEVASPDQVMPQQSTDPGDPVPEGGPAAAGSVLAAEGLDVSYGQLQVLFGVDFALAEGEMVALLGTNGAGKSTLLKAMVGLVPSSGSVYVDGEAARRVRPDHLARSGVVLMSGGKSIFPTLTVDEHLRLATWMFRRDQSRVVSDRAGVLAMFPVLKGRMRTLAGDLSGGEQQQLALAQTLLLRPRVLLIDELSLGLAPTIVGQLLDVVRSLNARGTSIIVVEQSVNVALALAERAVFMEKGRVRFEGPTRDLLDRPDILRSVFLEGASAIEPGAGEHAASSNGSTPGGLNGSSSERGDAAGVVDLSALSTLRELESTPQQSDGPVLECRQVTKYFGGVRAVDQVDLAVEAGEIVGLVGQNGAGKTTLVDCISGFHSLDGGSIHLRGYDVTEWEPWERARGRLGRSFQEARLFPSLTVTETVSVACERHVSSRAIIGDAFRQPAAFESEQAVSERVAELVELLGLAEHRDKRIAELSTGTRRIVELACLLAEDPVVLCLDEPSAGVAQRETEALGPLLGRIRDVTGAAMVVIEHDMPLLSGLCDRLVALELGGVIASGRPDDVLADEHVVAAYLGTDQSAINRSDSSASQRSEAVAQGTSAVR